MKKVKLISLMLVFVLVFTLAGCGSKTPASSTGTDSGKTYTLQYACSASDKVGTEPSTRMQIATKLKETLEAKTNGKVKLEIYFNGTLGSDREIIEGVQAGNISVGTMTTAPQVTFIPSLAIFDLPNAFPSKEVANKVLSSGKIRDTIAADYDKAGLKLLSITPFAYREMSTNKPVRKIEDFKGIKIRTMENKNHIAYWTALGANPSPLAYSELYIALQQGTFDAQENPLEEIYGSKMYEQQKYIVNTNHIFFVNTIFINKKLYDEMPADLKKAMEDSFKEVDTFSYQLTDKAASNALQALKDKGLEIIDLPADMLAKMKDLAKPVYDQVRTAVGAELVDNLLKEIDAASK